MEKIFCNDQILSKQSTCFQNKELQYIAFLYVNRNANKYVTTKSNKQDIVLQYMELHNNYKPVFLLNMHIIIQL